MFGVLKKMFGKSDSEVPASSVPLLPESKPRFGNTVPKKATAPSVAPVLPAPEPQPAALSATASFDSDAVNVPYAAILKQVPRELWGRLAPAGVAGLEFPVARQQVLAQLTHGVIKVTFGEIRHGVPKSVFIDSDAHDHELVPLPLGEILAQLHPDAYARRANQVTAEVPAELSDLFGPKGERLSAVRVAEKAQPARAPSPAQRPVKSVSAATQAAAPPASSLFVPPASAAFKPAPPSAKAVTPETPSPARPRVSSPLPGAAAAPASAPALVEQPSEAKTVSFPGTPIVPTPAATEGQPAPAAPRIRVSPTTKPVVPVARFATPLPKTASLPKPNPAPPVAPLPAVGPAQAVPADRDSGTLLVAMADLADEWPAEIRQEIAQLQTPNPQVALPLAELGQALKRGRVQYRWKQLRAWLTPAQFFDVPSPYSEAVLDLPTKVLTPLYIDKTHGTSFFKKQSYADKIPDVLAKAERPVAPRSAVHAASPVPIEPAPPAPAVAVAEPAPMPAPPPLAVDVLTVKLATVFADWPEPVRHEIAMLGLDDGQLEIPFAVLDRDLKYGRLAYAWNDILSWVNPPAPDIHTSPNGETVLELPLHQIAPLFFQQRPQAAKKKSALPTNIPDLFSSSGQVQTAPAPVPAPLRPMTTPVAPVVEAPPAAPEPVSVQPPKPPETLSELFGQPPKQNWSPNELVQKTAALPGLAGALIALQDGFPVAASLPPGWKTEIISAFLPQIFGRMSQYCREIGLGETKNVTFSIEEGTFQIFKAGIIYLAVLAQPGATVPEAAVALIARELSRHTK